MKKYYLKILSLMVAIISIITVAGCSSKTEFHNNLNGNFGNSPYTFNASITINSKKVDEHKNETIINGKFIIKGMCTENEEYKAIILFETPTETINVTDITVVNNTLYVNIKDLNTFLEKNNAIKDDYLILTQSKEHELNVNIMNDALEASTEGINGIYTKKNNIQTLHIKTSNAKQFVNKFGNNVDKIMLEEWVKFKEAYDIENSETKLFAELEDMCNTLCDKMQAYNGKGEFDFMLNSQKDDNTIKLNGNITQKTDENNFTIIELNYEKQKATSVKIEIPNQ